MQIEAEIVPAGKGLPFLCSLCGEVDTSKDYLRMFQAGDVNGICQHIECIYKKAEERRNAISESMARLTEPHHLFRRKE